MAGMVLFRSLGWAACSQGARVLLQVGILAAMSRMLSISAFGTFALAAMAIALGHLVRDLGTSAALVRHADPRPQFCSAVFFFNCACSFVLGVALYLAAEPLSRLFENDELRVVAQASAFIFPAAGLGSVSQALLERSFKFKQLAVAEIVAGILGGIVGLAMAYTGWGALSLVGQTVAAALIGSILLLFFQPIRVCRFNLVSELAGIYRFSGNLIAFNLLNYGIRNLDALIIGKWFGAAGLGIYSVATKVLLFPIQNVSSVLNRVTFPLYSRGTAAELRLAVPAVLQGISLVVTPVMVLVALEAEAFVALILGARWTEAAPIARWLAVAGIFQAVTAASGSVFTATGRTDTLRKIGVYGLLFFGALYIVGAQTTLVGFVQIYLAGTCIWTIVVIRMVAATAHLSRRDLAAAFLPAGSALVAALVMHQAASYVLQPVLGGALEVLTVAAVFLAAYVTAAMALFGRKLREALLFFTKERDMAPALLCGAGAPPVGA